MNTKVVFRKFLDGQIIALFPEMPARSSEWWECESYMHVGQHAAADPLIVRETLPATPEEYAPLKTELESIGYTLRIMRRITQSDHAARRREWQATSYRAA